MQNKGESIKEKLHVRPLSDGAKTTILRWVNRFSVVLQFLACCLGYFLIEALSRHSLGKAWTYLWARSWVFLYNSFLIFLTTLPVYLVRRRFFARSLIGILWMILGITNSVVLANRVTPLTGPDVKLLSEGLGVITKYMSIFQMVLLGLLLLALLVFLVVLFLRAPKYQGKRHFALSLPLIAVSVALFFGATSLLLRVRQLSNYFGNIASAYEDYGFAYCLGVTCFDTGISSPNGYSEALVETIQKNEGKIDTDVPEKLPNIIFLQLESFMDPERVRYLSMSEDPMPYMRKLMKKYSSGFYTVPSVGAGTANTEFESITGMNMRFFGPGEYPYKSVLKENTCESAAYVLDAIGYTSHAIHNNEANFYSRRTVFANLGFDTFTSEEYMPTQDDVTETGWMKDETLIQPIRDCLNSTKGSDYIYTISVQGHGSYPTEPTIVNPQITVSGSSSDEENCAWEYYVNQIREMDTFVKKLTTMLADYGEDTVLVMYGDHLPTMGLTQNDLKRGTLFQTQYVIWDNMGLKRQTKNIYAYQMAAEVMDRLDIHKGTMMNFHQTMKKKRLYTIDLQTLQYDILYGEKYVYGGESPFLPTNMQLGVLPVRITGIKEASGGNYYIQGVNFTQSSKVVINDDVLDTTFISPTTLFIQGQELKNLTRVYVIQQSNSTTAKELSRSQAYVFSDYFNRGISYQKDGF